VAKVKFVLDPAPTFKAKVELPVHGGNTVPVEFTFKHRTKDEMAEFIKSTMNDAESVMAMCEGWELEDEFNAENVAKMCQNYQGSWLAVLRTYAIEIQQAKLGN
jgi:putative N-acetylmannosamine-6-phosphate epimerase